MINWKLVEEQVYNFVSNRVDYITANGVQVMNELIISVNYLSGNVSLLIDNPAALYNDDESSYTELGKIEIEEWINDTQNTPSLTEEEFHKQATVCLKKSILQVQDEKGFESLNPTLPFMVCMSEWTFPDEELFEIGVPANEEGDGKTSMKRVMNENIAKSEHTVNGEYNDMLANAQKQMQEMYGNMPGMEAFANVNLGEMMQNSVNNFLDSVDEEDCGWNIIYSPDRPYSEEQQKYLALGSIMKVAREEHVDSLYSGSSALRDHIDTLQYQWEVSDHDSSVHVLDWLKNEGHRSVYKSVKTIIENNQWYDVLVKIESELPVELDLDMEDEDDRGIISRALSFYDNMKQSVRHNQKFGGYYTYYPETISAWDYGRLVNLSCWCFECGYITEEEAWGYIGFAKEYAMKDFNSWTEYGQNYLFGRGVWNFETVTNQPMNDICDLLLNDDNSPWRKYEFK